MNRRRFPPLYDFNSWANQRTLDSCIPLNEEQFTRDLKSSFNSVRDTLVHIVSAEWIWLERWHGRTPTSFPKAPDYPDLESVRNYASKIDRDLIDFVSSLKHDDLQRVISYKRITGEAYAQPLWQLCSTWQTTAPIIAAKSRRCCGNSARSPFRPICLFFIAIVSTASPRLKWKSFARLHG